MAGKNLSAFLTVDLAMNTAKFQKSIKGASGTTKTLLTALNKITVASKKTASALLSVGKTLAGIGAGAALGGLYALYNGASDNVKAFEDLRAKLSGVTGDLQSAEKVFWELNALEDQTTKSTTELSEALLYLNKFGIGVTSEDMKNLSAVSIGLNKDLASVTSAIGKAAQGRYQGIKELGIAVEDAGNTLKLSFKGVTTEVEKDTDAIKNYLSNLGKTQFSEVLEAKLQTTDAALNRFKNAWGTLQTEIFRSDGVIGQIFTNIYNQGTDMVNGLITVFKLESVQKVIKGAVEHIFNFFKIMYESITGKAITFKTDWAEIWLNILNTVNLAIAKFKLLSASLISGFKVLAGAFDDFVYKPIKALMNKIMREWDEWQNHFWKKIGEIGTRISAPFVSLAMDYAELSAEVSKEMDENGSSLNDALKEREGILNEAAKDYAETLENIRKSEEELKKSSEGKQGESVLDNLFGASSGNAVNAINTAGKKASNVIDTLKREWDSFYKSLVSESRNSLSERQRLEIEYNEKNIELQKYAAVASAEEISKAKQLIEEQYQLKKKELEENAQKEYYSIMENETELLRMETQKRIDIINQMYKDNLLSATQYMEAQSKLIDSYYKNAGKKKTKDTILSDESVDRVTKLKDVTQTLSDAFSDMAGSMNKSSSSYKALFAIQKGFAVASATMNAILAWSQALSDPTQMSWIAKLTQYANAIALTANIISQLRSVQMYDKGGEIKAGELGIVGEYGPELIQGPATVTSRTDTADILNRNQSNIVVNLIEDNEKAGNVTENATDEETIIDIFVSNIRRGGSISGTLESTYNLRRYGV